NSGVVAGRSAEGETQFEVLDLTFSANQERISIRSFFLGGFPMDDAVANGPQTGVAVPAGQVFAVEQRLHSLGFRRRIGGPDGGSREGEQQAQRISNHERFSLWWISAAGMLAV